MWEINYHWFLSKNWKNITLWYIKRINKNNECISTLQEFGINEPIRFNAIKHDIGLIGCVKSHIKCIELAKERQYPFVCIFEDDIYFIDSDKLILYINRYINIDYDVLYLGTWIYDNKYKKLTCFDVV